MLASRTGKWSLGTALLCVVLLAASWFLLISPRRADASDIEGQAEGARSQAATLQTQIDELKAQFLTLPAQLKDLDAIQGRMPTKLNMPALLRTIKQQAADSKVVLVSITPGTPVVATPPGVSAPPTPGEGTLVSIPLVMEVQGTYSRCVSFLKRMQTGIQRSILITGLGAGPYDPQESPTPAAPVTPTSVPTTDPEEETPLPTATPTATPTVTLTAPGVPDLSYMSLNINSAVYVLLDDVVTLDDVKKEVQESATGVAPPAAGAPGAPAAPAAPNAQSSVSTS